MSSDSAGQGRKPFSLRMQERGMTVEALARESRVSVKTVRRLVSGGSAPRQGTADSLCAVLVSEPKQLWPHKFSAAPVRPAHSHALTAWETRAEVPVAQWRELFEQAEDHLDVLVYGGTFLFDSVPNFIPRVRQAITEGAQVRFLIGDPDSYNVRQRGVEEGIHHSLAGRCELTLSRLTALRDPVGTNVRKHDTPLYVSIFRVDDVAIVNPHIYGSPASDNPAMLVDREAQPALFAAYINSFDRVWGSAHPA